MKVSTEFRHQRNGSRLAVVGVMLLLWVGIWVLAASPRLHLLLHRDAQDVTHNCAVTQVQHQLLVAGSAPLVPAALPAIAPAPACTAEAQFVPTTDYRLSPSRAPPSLISALRVVG